MSDRRANREASGLDAGTAAALVEFALRWLDRMYLRDQHLFCFKAVLDGSRSGGDPDATGAAGLGERGPAARSDQPASQGTGTPAHRIVDVSPLYTAIVLVGLRRAEAAGLDHGFDRRAIGAALADRIDDGTDWGTAALAVWALADTPAAADVLDLQLDRIAAVVRGAPECGGDTPCPLTTMQACWIGSALLSLLGGERRRTPVGGAGSGHPAATVARARALLEDTVRLVRACRAPGGASPSTRPADAGARPGARRKAADVDGPAASGPLFTYVPPSYRFRGPWAPWARLRAPYCYFAEQVYGILFLSDYAAMSGDDGALAVARRTAGTVVEAQDAEGGWAWLYDSRDGGVVDPYPLYAVHQDAMAPMALLALAAAEDQLAGDRDDAGRWIAAVDRSYGFLSRPVGDLPPIWDRRADLMYRSVRRRLAPNLFHNLAKVLHRGGLEAALPAATRFPGLGFDRELRPYHMGWILYALARISQRAP